jgi:hypothetical protein
VDGRRFEVDHPLTCSKVKGSPVGCFPLGSVSRSTGLRTADCRTRRDVPAAVAGAERPRTRLRRVPAAASVMDFGTFPGQRDRVGSLRGNRSGMVLVTPYRRDLTAAVGVRGPRTPPGRCEMLRHCPLLLRFGHTTSCLRSHSTEGLTYSKTRISCPPDPC